MIRRLLATLLVAIARGFGELPTACDRIVDSWAFIVCGLLVAAALLWARANGFIY